MFRWYQNADVCYAYLEDVDVSPDPLHKDQKSNADLLSQFKSSKWFTRGWTLQELIAPAIVIFYSSHWSKIGTRDTLRKTISVCTGIAPELFRSQDLKKFSIAQKMSVSIAASHWEYWTVLAVSGLTYSYSLQLLFYLQSVYRGADLSLSDLVGFKAIDHED